MNSPLFHKRDNQNYTGLLVVWVLTNVLFSVGYWLLSIYSPADAPTFPAHETLIMRFLESLYFSIITATSVGYGDIVPMGFSKLLAIVHSILALLVFAIFVTKLVSRRQDLAVQEVHRMTSESVFHHVRAGMYVVRKDFDRIIRLVERKEALTPHDWDNIATAFLQAQSVTEEIPEFYGKAYSLYVIDEKRERLLIESLERTLRRIHHMLAIMEDGSIDWRMQENAVQELTSLISTLSTIVPRWQTRSPHARDEHFTGVRQAAEAIGALLGEKAQ